MEKSDYFYRRKHFMDNLLVPTISEIKAELGDNLSEAFFATCPDPMKPIIGITPTLIGAGEDLWVSPSDTLIGKVVLKPPLTNKHKKALTHQGILTIGQDIEVKFWNEAELEKMRTLAEQEELLLFMAEMDKRRAVEEARKQERAVCEEQKEEMRIEFAATLKFALQQLENRLREEYEQLMKEQKGRLDEEWQEKLEDAVAEVTAKLMEQFNENMKKQEDELQRRFKIELTKENIKRKLELKEMEECFRDSFMQLKHQSECKNIANVMYILCMERRRCQTDMENIEANYQKAISELLNVINTKSGKIKTLKEETAKCKRDLNLREECLLEMIRQFQKFINFALQAVPTQGEFLLNVEKLMIFELTEAICQSDEKRGKRLASKLMKWKSDVELPPTLDKEETILKDHHNCYVEVDTPVSSTASVVGDADYLPAFSYDESMYVKEEFRNMMSQGIRVRPSNLFLWNKDVEHYQELLRRSITSLQEQKRKEEEERNLENKKDEDNSVQEEKLDVAQKPADLTKSQQSRKSSVYFKGIDGNYGFVYPSLDVESMRETPSEIYGKISPQIKDSSSSLFVEGVCCRPCPKDGKPNRDEPANRLGLGNIPSAVETNRERFSSTLINMLSLGSHLDTASILGTRDSLTKHRLSVKPISKILLHRENILSKDVIVLNKKPRNSSHPPGTSEQEIASSSDSIESSSESLLYDENLSKITDEDISKLSLSRNSYFFNKHSLYLKSRGANSPNGSKSPSVKSSKSANQSLLHDLNTELMRKKIHEMSKLSIARDSLQLSRRKVNILRGEGTYLQRTCDSEETCEISEVIKTQKRLLKQQVKTGETKKVVVSALKLKECPSIKQSRVMRKAPCPVYDLNVLTADDSISQIYKPVAIDLPPQPPADIITKPNVAKVVGDKYSTEHKEKIEDFTLHRANSLISTFRKHPSLIKIFTSVTK